MIQLIFSKINEKERKTFILHFVFSVMEGFIAGFLMMNEFVFLKSLKGSNAMLAVLFQMGVVVFIFSSVFNELSRQVSNKKKLILYSAIFTRFPLFLFVFFPTDAALAGSTLLHVLFITAFMLYYLAQPLIYPTVNMLLKANYSDRTFGKLFSYATTAKQISLLLATFGFGLWLDADNFAFRYVYPLMGFFSIFSVYLLTKIDSEKAYIEALGERKNVWLVVVDSVKSMNRILKINKPYRDFERGFMFYGFAFMITAAIISIFMAKELDLSFSGIAFYKNYYNTLGIILLPFFGKLIGKIDPRNFGAITFASLLFHFLFLIVAQWFPYNFDFLGIKIFPILLISFFFNGIFAATMSLLWSIGSAYFCNKNEAADYQSIHLTLVGFRSSFAPLIGVIILHFFDYAAVFWTAIALLLISIAMLLISVKKYTLKIQ